MASPVDLPPRRHRYSVADFYGMGDAGILAPDARVELIDGEVIDMAPIGSPHAGIVNVLTRRFVLAVDDRATVAIQNPVRLDDFSQPQPDVALLRPRADGYAGAMPTGADVLLLVEVAASSLAFDRDVKAPLYARHGIPEFWLVDVEGRRVVRYAGPAAGAYGVREPLGSLAQVPIPGLSGLRVDLGGIVPEDPGSGPVGRSQGA
jgi:Uma2 family endonuclease